jgi:hypothetical protein
MYEIVERCDVFVVLAQGEPVLSFCTVEDALNILATLETGPEAVKYTEHASCSS